jgi:hypothetical protein
LLQCGSFFQLHGASRAKRTRCRGRIKTHRVAQRFDR